MAATQIQKVSHNHDKIIDHMLANPARVRLGQLAEDLGYTLSWISIVTNSDVFKVKLAQRRKQYNGLLAEDAIRTGFEAGIKANERLKDYLDQELEDLDPSIVLNAAVGLADKLYSPTRAKVPVSSYTKEIERYIEMDNGILSSARERIREQFNDTPALSAPADNESN